MVHTVERCQAADLLQQFFDGKITNDEFDNDYPTRSGDPGLDVIYDRIWLYYNDVSAEFFDREALKSQEREMVERCIAFLRTDFEYEGLLLSRGLPAWQRIVRLIGLNIGSKRPSHRTNEFPDPYWPFATNERYQQTKPGGPS